MAARSLFAALVALAACIVPAHGFAPRAVAARARLPLASRGLALRLEGASIQFYPGTDEPDIPDIRLTRSVDAQTGVARFRFDKPSFFQEENEIPDELFKSMVLVDEEGELSTVKVDATYENGKPKAIEATYEMITPSEWDRFMRFMERYAEANGLGFSAA